MRIYRTIPNGAVRNADILGVSQLRLNDGERVVDINRDLSDLPAGGRIVIAERNVLKMGRKLGYEFRTKEEEAELQAELAELRNTAAEFADLKERLANV